MEFTSLKQVRLLAEAHNGRCIGVESTDHDGERSNGMILAFLWDDEDDSDCFVGCLGDHGVRVERVTHEHRKTIPHRGVLESRVVLADSDPFPEQKP